MKDPQNAYREEAYELLSELETGLLDLENRPDDQELVGSVFRVMHTIKGSGAMFGFDDIAAFTHELETAYDLVRDGKLRVTKDLINLSLSARDQIAAMLDASANGEGVDPVESDRIVESLRAIMAPGQLGQLSATPTPHLSQEEVHAGEEGSDELDKEVLMTTAGGRWSWIKRLSNNSTIPWCILSAIVSITASNPRTFAKRSQNLARERSIWQPSIPAAMF